MGDDREVRCYALLIEQIKGTAPAGAIDEVLRNWYGQREADDGCTHAVAEFYADKKVTAMDIWRKARLSAEANRARATRSAVEIVAPEALPLLREVFDSPSSSWPAVPRPPGACARNWWCSASSRWPWPTPAARRGCWTPSGACSCRPRSATGSGA